MKPKKDKTDNENPPQQVIHEYQVCEVESATCVTKYGMYISQPWKYAGTHILLHCGMVLHYFATFGFLHPALQAINIFLHVLNTVVLVILAFTDPGMIPKIHPTYEKLQYRQIPTNYHHYSTLLRYFQKNYRMVIKGHNLPLKFCNTCYIYRPPRAVHCEDCGTCIQKFDHHCPWIGTCVAKRNYKYFLSFLVVLSMLTTKLFIQTVIVTSEHTNWQGPSMIAKSVLNIFLCIYTFPAMGFALFMLILHLKFVATNVTTNEFCKQTWETLEGNPFKKQSWIKNILRIVSFHYQGKVRFEQPVYNRNDRIMLLNESVTSLNESKEANKTLNQVNQSKYNSHKQYSTNDKDKIEKKDEQKMNNTKQQDDLSRPTKYMQKQEFDLKRQNGFSEHGRKVQQSIEQKQADPMSIYDISIKLNQRQKTTKVVKQPSSILATSSQNQQKSSSLQSQKDQSSYQREQLDRQQQRKLKVIEEQNQSQYDQTISKSPPISPQKSIDPPNNKEISLIKIDESMIDDHVLKEKQQDLNIQKEVEKKLTSNGTIQIGNFRKRKKSTSSEPKFL